MYYPPGYPQGFNPHMPYGYFNSMDSQIPSSQSVTQPSNSAETLKALMRGGSKLLLPKGEKVKNFTTLKGHMIVAPGFSEGRIAGNCVAYKTVKDSLNHVDYLMCGLCESPRLFKSLQMIWRHRLTSCCVKEGTKEILNEPQLQPKNTETLQGPVLSETEEEADLECLVQAAERDLNKSSFEAVFEYYREVTGRLTPLQEKSDMINAIISTLTQPPSPIQRIQPDIASPYSNKKRSFKEVEAESLRIFLSKRVPQLLERFPSLSAAEVNEACLREWEMIKTEGSAKQQSTQTVHIFSDQSVQTTAEIQESTSELRQNCNVITSIPTRNDLRLKLLEIFQRPLTDFTVGDLVWFYRNIPYSPFILCVVSKKSAIPQGFLYSLVFFKKTKDRRELISVDSKSENIFVFDRLSLNQTLVKEYIAKRKIQVARTLEESKRIIAPAYQIGEIVWHTSRKRDFWPGVVYASENYEYLIAYHKHRKYTGRFVNTDLLAFESLKITGVNGATAVDLHYALEWAQKESENLKTVLIPSTASTEANSLVTDSQETLVVDESVDQSHL